MPTITQHELRENLSDLLRRAEAGEELTVTVDGRVVARLGPALRRQWVSGPALQRVWDTPAPEVELDTFPAELIDPFADAG